MIRATPSEPHAPSSQPHAARRALGWPPRLLRPTVAQRVFLVGAIPAIAIAAIAALSIVLLDRADLARAGALEASTIYRQVVSGMAAQDAFVRAQRLERARSGSAFTASVTSAAAGLERLGERTRDPEPASAIEETLATLERYRLLMGELTVSTRGIDELTLGMDRRLETLVTLTDEARARQKRANRDLVATLKQRDERLKRLREVVDTAQSLRGALADGMIARAASAGGTADGTSGAGAPRSFEEARVQNGFDQLAEALQRARNGGIATGALPALSPGLQGAGRLLGWLDRELKINATAQRTLQTEIADLLAYTIGAQETEQATQSIATDTLKLGRAGERVLQRRSPSEVAGLLTLSRAIGDKIASLPISPLIQSDMIDVVDRWQADFNAMREALATQNGLLVAMSDTAGVMLLQVTALNNDLSAHADEIGTAVRRIMVVGGGLAFLLASLSALLVARSITRPLGRLERDMIDRALNGGSALLPGADRRDEVGSMTRATNRFLTELNSRETALRAAKDDADDALRRLRDTQSDLIQAEKLASLGQLVAGVAHEINTPLGVALTTSTTMGGEVARFREEVLAGQLTQGDFEEFVERLGEGARLTTANVQRAAHLVHAFKQVAADRTSDERRRFEIGPFAADLFTSLGPMGRRAGHRVEMSCEAGILMDSYPGALAQVLTNLLSNAYAHAFAERSGGHVAVAITRRGGEGLRIRFADDGRGIAPGDRPRIFDPFFTTRRAEGSTGLGLQIVYNLVTATLGGTIRFASEEGRGTTFTLDLPLDAPHGAPSGPTEALRAAAVAIGPRVLAAPPLEGSPA